MRTRVLRILLAAAVSSGAFLSCGPSPEADARADTDRAGSGTEAELLVYVVNYPLRYIAERIGGDRVSVEFPAPPDIDPAVWSPDPETVAAYQTADLILLNGAAYAGWVDRASLPPSRQVLTTMAISDRLIVAEDAVTHTHGPEGEHAHWEVAFTTWLDPSIAIAQAAAVHEAMRVARPEAQAELQAGFAALERDLQTLDAEMSATFGRDPDRPLLASHPVYQYLARRYGLNLVSLHLEPDEEPTGSQWRELAEALEEHPARWMLWEAEPLAATRTRLEELGVGVLVFNPLGNAPAAGDYLSEMRENAGRLEAAYR